jgi:hypothetical protein
MGNGRLIDTPLGAPYTEFTICRLEKWGSAVKIGRGPATVIGSSAVSQATLLSRIGCLSFAREDSSGNGPRNVKGLFYCSNSRTTLVRGDSCHDFSVWAGRVHTC